MITLAYLQVLLQLHHILNGWELQRLRGVSPSYLRDGPPALPRAQSAAITPGMATVAKIWPKLKLALRKSGDQERTGDTAEPADA
jgi:hypothetical protein